MEETLTTTQDVLIKVLLYLPVPQKAIVSQEAQVAFLKNLIFLRSLYQYEDQGDHEEKEEEAHTVISEEDND